MTSELWAKALTGRPESEGLTRYAWMDHNGWHTAEELPTGIVPTGHVWAWGAHVWAYWREEHQRSEVVGIVVRQDSQKPVEGEWEEATVDPPLPSDSEQKAKGTQVSQAKVQPPALHSDTRFFETIGEGGPFSDYGKPVQLVRVMSPARIDLFSRSDA